MDAIVADSKNFLRWSRKGHILAMDIAKGLVHLHANKVPHPHPCDNTMSKTSSLAYRMCYMKSHLIHTGLI